jgi:hypothetical protein
MNEQVPSKERVSDIDLPWLIAAYENASNPATFRREVALALRELLELRAENEPPAVPAVTDLEQYRCQPDKQTYCPHMDLAHALLAEWLKAWDAGSDKSLSLYERTRVLLKGRASQPPPVDDVEQRARARFIENHGLPAHDPWDLAPSATKQEYREWARNNTPTKEVR